MRPTARLALGIVTLLALGVGPTRVRAQGYAPGPRPTYYVQPRTYYVQPRTYYAQPRTYYAQPRTGRLLRVRKYSDRDTAAYKYILVDPNNRHWTFDYNDWIAHNF